MGVPDADQRGASAAGRPAGDAAADGKADGAFRSMIVARDRPQKEEPG